jgi:integrase/recombinase XerD
VNRAKREKTLPDVLGKDEIKRILDVAAKDLRFFCIFSILYPPACASANCWN